VIDKWIDKDH